MKFSTEDLLKLCFEFNDTRLTSIVAQTRDAEFEFEDDPAYLTDIDYIVEVGDWFYSQFCKTCNPIQCNYCPSYAWHTLTNFNEKIYLEDEYKSENKNIFCTEKCENCIHKCRVELFNWYIGQEDIFYCDIKNCPDTCEDKEVYNANQLTLDDILKGE
jgi:hypothetical protein